MMNRRHWLVNRWRWRIIVVDQFDRVTRSARRRLSYFKDGDSHGLIEIVRNVELHSIARDPKTRMSSAVFGLGGLALVTCAIIRDPVELPNARVLSVFIVEDVCHERDHIASADVNLRRMIRIVIAVNRSDANNVRTCCCSR
jgi:hypothetical protein